MLNLELKEKNVKIVAVNPRAELHGDSAKPACDVKIEVMLLNDDLAMFHPTLKSLLYVKNDQRPDLVEQANPEGATMLRFPQLDVPLKWKDECLGAAVTVHYGASEKSHVNLPGCVIAKPQIEPLEGGTIVLTCLIQCHPDEKQMGRLGMMVGTEIPVTIAPPESAGDSLVPTPGAE